MLSCGILQLCGLSGPNWAKPLRRRRNSYGRDQAVMPGPWVQSQLNPGWLASQTYAMRSLVEFVGYDDSAQPQGKVLASVQDTLERNEDGCWLAIRIICVQDVHLHWWLTKGPGAKLKNHFFFASPR